MGSNFILEADFLEPEAPVSMDTTRCSDCAAVLGIAVGGEGSLSEMVPRAVLPELAPETPREPRRLELSPRLVASSEVQVEAEDQDGEAPLAPTSPPAPPQPSPVVLPRVMQAIRSNDFSVLFPGQSTTSSAFRGEAPGGFGSESLGSSRISSGRLSRSNGGSSRVSRASKSSKSSRPSLHGIQESEDDFHCDSIDTSTSLSGFSNSWALTDRKTYKVLRDEFEDLCRKDPLLLPEIRRKKIYACSQTCFVGFTIVAMVRGLTLWTRSQEDGPCQSVAWGSPHSGETHKWSMALEGAWCLLLLLLLAWFVRKHRPRRAASHCCGGRADYLWVYHFIIYSILYYTMILALIPTENSCDGLIEYAFCDGSVDLAHNINSVNCEMIGSTPLMVDILMLAAGPHILPSLKGFLVLPLYLATFVAVFFISSLRYPVGSRFYSWRDLLFALLVLCLVASVAIRRMFLQERSELVSHLLEHRKRQATCHHLRLLHHMVPRHMVPKLLEDANEGVIAEQVDRASVLFIKIVDFDTYATGLSPTDLLVFLNYIFTAFDEVCSKRKVTKIETVGEEYVAAVGVTPEDMEEDTMHGHTEILDKLIDAAATILRMQREVDVQFRMGVHTGPLVAGVIGQKLPRFRLFGDTVNTAARLMQKGEDGKLQMGEETKRELPDWVRVTSRGNIELKGKGSVAAYFLDADRAAEGESVPESVTFGRGAGPGASAMSDLGADSMALVSQAVSSLVISSMQLDRVPSVRSQSSSLSAFRAKTTAHPRPRMSKEASLSSLSSNLSGTVKAARRSLTVSRSSESMYTRITNWCGLLAQRFLLPCPCARSGAVDSTRLLPEEQELWLKRFYHTLLWKRLPSYTFLKAAALLVITAVEAFVAHDIGWDQEDETLYGYPRRDVFLGARGAILIGSLLFCCFGRRCLVDSPRLTELVRVVCLLVNLVLIFLSYDALKPAAMDLTNVTHEEVRDSILARPLRVDIWTLLFICFYTTIIMSMKVRFFYAAFVVILSLAFMSVVHFSPGVFFNLWLDRTKVTIVFGMSCFGLNVSRLQELRSKSHFHTFRGIETANSRIEAILHKLMPPLVVEEEMARGLLDAPLSHRYPRATVVHLDLVGFTELASTRTATEVVAIISELFGLFDGLADQFDVYKVETVGDAYIAAQADLPLTRTNRPLGVVLFGCRVVEVVKNWSNCRSEIEEATEVKTPIKMSVRVGVHTGECIGGMVGQRMRRYHLFGRLLAEVQMLEATSPAGAVQLSGNCMRVVEAQMREEGIPESVIRWESTTAERLTTSKGEAVSWPEVGGFPTYLVQESAPQRYLRVLQRTSTWR